MEACSGCGRESRSTGFSALEVVGLVALGVVVVAVVVAPHVVAAGVGGGLIGSGAKMVSSAFGGKGSSC